MEQLKRIKRSSKDDLKQIENQIDQAKKKKMPDWISPMLALTQKKPFNDENWIFEIKWDGYRALAFINRGNVQLKSRNKISWNASYPSIIQELKKFKGQAILDGELVVLDHQGRPSFQAIQNYYKESQGDLIYYVFDILYKDGKDLRHLPLIKRKQVLQEFINQSNSTIVRFSDHLEEKGILLFKEASKNKLEGIIGKKKESAYLSQRSANWVKIKTGLRQEVVIAGLTPPRGSRKKFGALIIGIYDENKKFRYAGKVGGGFDAAHLEEISGKLEPLIQKKSPFQCDPHLKESIIWVKPKLICEVSFAEWTKEGRMRQPIFRGMRTDKKAKEIRKELSDALVSTRKPMKKTDENKSLTHLDKVYWKKKNYTKGDLLEYYQTVAPFLLKYLKNRPIMLHRFPEGIEEEGFYQKNINFSPPSWLKTYPIQHSDSMIHYMGINNMRSLLFAINLGTIDIHPFLSRYEKLEYPDFCVIDFDPHDIAFKNVIEAVLVAHEILEEAGVKNYCKTSGNKGLHLFIPLKAKYTYEQSKRFALTIASLIHEKLPRTTSLERSPKRRERRIYLDCLQNRFGQTIVAPYSARPNEYALVSTPLEWNEVDFRLDPREFDIKTIPQRLKEKGDLWLNKKLNTKTQRHKDTK